MGRIDGVATDDFALYCCRERAAQLEHIVSKWIRFGADKIHMYIHWRKKESYMAQLWRAKVRLIETTISKTADFGNYKCG